MTARALIIAIESYDKTQSGGVAKHLPGTLQAGLDFRNWLEAKWKREGEVGTQTLFLTDPPQPGGTAADSKSILRALRDLKLAGQNQTKELFFFFSGHGFCFEDRPGSRADIIVASDFEDAFVSGASCLNLTGIINWLSAHLGPGTHFYFVDACRNIADTTLASAAATLIYDQQRPEEASTLLLQSVGPGSVSPVGGKFPTALMSGLEGKGKAKQWQRTDPTAMYVRGDSLLSYLKLALPKQQIGFSAGGTEAIQAVLATIAPVTPCKCTIMIKGANGALRGEVLLQRGATTAEQRVPLTGAQTVVEVAPDDYRLTVSLEGHQVEPPGPVTVDLYEDRTETFKVIPPDFAGGLESLPTGDRLIDQYGIGEVDVEIPPDMTLELLHMDFYDQVVESSGRHVVLAGYYRTGTLKAPSGRAVSTVEGFEVPAGGVKKLSVIGRHNSAPHRAIGMRLQSDENGGLWFSESLGGPVTDEDLDLWLALLGTGRILGPKGEYAKLADFPLFAFGEEEANSSPIYVLAGFEDPGSNLQVGLTKEPEWSSASEPQGMAGIREAYLAPAPGPQLVSFAIDNYAPYTIASMASPNRCMFITLTLDGDGRPQISQYLLPLGHLVDQLPERVRYSLEGRRQLLRVRQLVEAVRSFRKRRNVVADIADGELINMLKMKWLDPIACALAAYEYLRRGKQDFGEATKNLKEYFKDVPDTAALARLNGEAGAAPTGVPLFLDGLRAFPDYAEWLPLPAGHLDFSSPWTAWNAAVARPLS